ncbi:MAG: hypothetical protein V3T19_11500, partial [Acidiferrobacterales bacterium]
PIAEVRAPMSAFAPISSASHPGADLPGGVAEGPFLTLSGHSLDCGVQKAGVGKRCAFHTSGHTSARALVARRE